MVLATHFPFEVMRLTPLEERLFRADIDSCEVKTLVRHVDVNNITASGCAADYKRGDWVFGDQLRASAFCVRECDVAERKLAVS